MIMEILENNARDLLELKLSYKVWQDYEDSIESNGGRIQVFFDTLDVIRMIQGLYAFHDNLSINIKRFKEIETLIHCIAFKGWLQEIHILPPHQDELLSKLSDSSFKHIFPDSIKMIKENFIAELEHSIPGFNYYSNGFGENTQAEEHTSKKIREISDNGQEYFKLAMLCAADKFHWNDRLKYLLSPSSQKGKPLLVFNDEGYAFEKISKEPLFKTLRTALDSERDRLSRNNIVDAIALYMLQEKLALYQEDKKNNPLPLFMINSFKINSVIEKVQNTIPDFLCYYHDGVKIPIYRKAEYFLVNVIYPNGNKDDQFLNEYYKEITQANNLHKLEIFVDYAGSNRSIDANNKINFFKIWLKKNKQEVQSAISNVINYFSESDILEINRYSEENIAKIERNLNQFKLISEIAKGTDLIEKSIKNNFKSDAEMQHSLNVFRDFSLTRFGIDQDNALQIQKNYEELKSDADSGKLDLVRNLLTEISMNAIHALRNGDYQGLISPFGLLWIFDQKKLIEVIYDNILKEHKNPLKSLPTPVLLVVSASINDTKGKLKDIFTELEARQTKAENKYEIPLGLSYSYFLLWYNMSDYPRTPGLGRPKLSHGTEDLPKKHEDYLFSSIENAKIAYQHLSKLISSNDEPSENLDKYKLKRFYAINNYVYAITQKTGNDVEIASDYFTDLVEQILYNCSDEYHQPRFHDTLARYYVRLARMESTPTGFEDYINRAKNQNEAAIHFTPKKRYKMYEDLKNELKDVKFF
jgi:hypothetical protein